MPCSLISEFERVGLKKLPQLLAYEALEWQW